jgi:hypothetical protein
MSLLPHAILILGAAVVTGCDQTEIVTNTKTGELVAAAEQEDVRLEIHADTLQAEAGEPIELIVTIEAPPRQRAELSSPRATSSETSTSSGSMTSMTGHRD